MSESAVVLLSGGIDSTTTLAIALSEGYHVFALSFRYGQRNRIELASAAKICQTMGVKDHRILGIELDAIGGSALTADIPIPKDRDESQIVKEIPATYVPARNIIFLSYGLALAESLGAGHLFIGVNAIDFSGYPDCRPEFIEAFQNVIDVGTKAGVEGRAIQIHAPLIRLPKAEIIRKGIALGVDYALTLSCYDPVPEGLACGRCDSCILRRRGFEEAGVPDPTQYAEI